MPIKIFKSPIALADKIKKLREGDIVCCASYNFNGAIIANINNQHKYTYLFEDDTIQEITEQEAVSSILSVDFPLRTCDICNNFDSEINFVKAAELEKLYIKKGLLKL